MSVDYGSEASVNGGGAAAHVADRVIGPRLPLNTDLAHTRPELLVGAAFVGGLVAAFLLRRLGR